MKWNRIIGLAIGLVYGVLYGLWTMFTTGGGHGNFIWFILFLLTYLFGLFFPVMGFLVVDLKPLWAKSAFGSLLIIHYLLFAIQIVPLLTGNGGEATKDVVETWNRSPSGFIFMSVIHVLPVIVLTAVFLKSVFLDRDVDGDETEIISIK